jgi:hypothetical protein
MLVYGDDGWESRTSGMAVNWRGYLIAGETKEPSGITKGFVISTDDAGDPRWSKRYGWEYSTDRLNALLPVSFWSQHALLAGQTNTVDGAGSDDGWLTRIDGNGDWVWSSLWGGSGPDSFSGLASTSDGNYLAVGTSHSHSCTAACWLVKFAPNGDRLWERIYDSDDSEHCDSISEIVDPTEPGGKALLMIGSRGALGPNRDVVVFKLTADGQIKWQRRIGVQDKFWGGVGAQILGPSNAPRGFIIGGVGPHYDEGMVVRLNDDGDYDEDSWAKVYYGGTGFGEGEIHSIVRTASGSFVYGGYTATPETNNDAWIFATDDKGAVLWSRAYGGWNDWEILSGVSSLGVVPGGRGLFAAGWSMSWSENLDPWAFVMDEQGRIPACSMIRPRPALPEDVEVLVEDPGMVSQPVLSQKTDLERVPDSQWSGKYMKLCPLGCLYKVDAKSTAPAPDGKEWETAFSKLQDGIVIAATEAPWSTQGRCEVWVAEGTYHAYQSSVEDSFALAYKVHLYGGFPGEDSGYSDHFNDREWELHKTVLTGYDEGGTERVYHVVTGAPGADDSVLDGFYVRDGAAGGTEFVDGAGAGLWLDGVSPEIRSCEITDNIAAIWGGGAAVRGGAPLFQGVRFVGNGYLASIRTAFGGGVYNQDTGAVYRGCSFTGNRARFLGGAMATAMFDPAAAAPMVLDSTFTMNEAPAGSAILTYNDPATTSPFSAQFHVNLLVHGNQSTGWEGVADGSILTWGAGQIPSFVHCTVADNTGALLTGGLQAVESNPIIVNSIFWGNHGPGQDCEICSDPAWDPSVWYSDIQEGWSGTGAGNIGDDIVLHDPLFYPGYKLGSGSPCIDTSLNLPMVPGYGWTADYVDHDIVPNPRPVAIVGPDPEYDMGCYERQEWEED